MSKRNRATKYSARIKPIRTNTARSSKRSPTVTVAKKKETYVAADKVIGKLERRLAKAKRLHKS